MTRPNQGLGSWRIVGTSARLSSSQFLVVKSHGTKAATSMDKHQLMFMGSVHGGVSLLTRVHAFTFVHAEAYERAVARAASSIHREEMDGVRGR